MIESYTASSYLKSWEHTISKCSEIALEKTCLLTAFYLSNKMLFLPLDYVGASWPYMAFNLTAPIIWLAYLQPMGLSPWQIIKVPYFLFHAAISSNPLRKAVDSGSIGDVRLLIEFGGVSVNKRDQSGKTPLYHAINKQDPKIVQILLEEGASVVGDICLHAAAQKLDENIVRMLLEAGAPIEAKDQNGCTPLHIAAHDGSKENVEVLLEAGADFEAVDDFHQTPIDYAMCECKKREEIMKLFKAKCLQKYQTVASGVPVFWQIAREHLTG